MRKLNIEDMNIRIRENTPRACLGMLQKERERSLKRRPGDQAEQDLLDKIYKEARTQAAVKEKVKICSEKERYYDFEQTGKIWLRLIINLVLKRKKGLSEVE